MYIVEVIPLGKGVIPESLSYFSHISYKRGALIQAPVRKRTVPAIVTNTTDAFTMKAALRAATFSLRRLPEQKESSGIGAAFFETAEKSAAYHGATLNTTLYALLPKEIREGTIPLRELTETEEHIPVFDTKPRILIAPVRERYQEYERMVRESFAAYRSILFVAPTIEHATQFETLLKKGIETYTVMLHGGLTYKALAKNYEVLHADPHPLLIIATPAYALAPRHDVGTILLEHERSNGYVGKTRPYLDFRFVITTYAALRGTTIILADTIPRSEEMFLLKNEEALVLEESPKRLELPGTLKILSLVADTAKDPEPFSLLSKELKTALDAAHKQKKHVFLFSARRGLAPLVACIDCGHILRDPLSGAPLALLRTTKKGVEERWLVSSVSGHREKATDLCPACGSWRLRERGIGIQQAYDELTKHYPHESIMLFDHQTASTYKKATRLRDAFYAGPGGILLGTALALPYLDKPLAMSAVMSMDSLRAIPSWRQQEEVFNILMSLREKTRGTVYVQTRTEDDLFELVRCGAIHDFYTEELKMREEFHYPPYVVFVHFAWKESEAHPQKQVLQELFAPYGISLYSAVQSEASEPKDGSLQYGLIRVPRESWPHPDIVARLNSLSPRVRVMINPDRIV